MRVHIPGQDLLSESCSRDRLRDVIFGFGEGLKFIGICSTHGLLGQ